MKKQRRNWWIGLCGVFAALGLATGVWMSEPLKADAAPAAAPTLTMYSGASVRKVAGDPGIKFTAKIDNYDRDYTYGMLILPESAWTRNGWDNDTDYVAELDRMGVSDYGISSCQPYLASNGDVEISLAMTDLHAENYGLGFIGVAYAMTKIDDEPVYTYADVNMLDNARSMAYVAQMALKYEGNITSEQKNILTSYTNAGVLVGKDEYFNDDNAVVGGSASVVKGNYAARFDVDYVSDGLDGTKVNSFVTKKAYPGGTTISFKWLIPNEAKVGGWWSICWTTDPSSVDIYAHTEGRGEPLSTSQGSWMTEVVTLPNDGKSYYVYFAGAKGEWGNYGKEGEGYVLIDDFTIGNTTEEFSKNTEDWIFDINSVAAVKPVEYVPGGMTFGEIPSESGEYSAKVYMDKINSAVGLATFVTKKSYPAGTTVTFKYYLPTDVKLGTWLKLACVADYTKSDIYDNWLEDLSLSQKGEWIEKTVTLSTAGYLYIAADVGQWGEGAGYVLFDDFSITTGGVTETDNFSLGVSEGLFNCNIGDAVVEGEGYVEIVDSTDYMLAFSEGAIGNGEKISVITENAYTNVTEITFKAIWSETAVSDRWGLSYTTNPSNFSYGAEVEALNCYTPKLGELKRDAGVIYEYRITFTSTSYTLYADGEKISSGSYTPGENYFYFMINPKGGKNVAFYLDDFTITTTSATFTEDFSGGTSTILMESGLKNSDRGSMGMSFEPSIFVEEVEPEVPDVPEMEELGEVALQIYFNGKGGSNNDGVRAVTSKAYPGGSNIEFKYYIQADQATQWTRFIWDTDTNCDNYADTFVSFGNTAGEWVTWNYTLPAGGPYYLYFGFECGNWKDSSGLPYILIDNFKVDGVVETFNNGVENSIFTILQPSLAGNSAVGDGFVKQSLGAKLLIDKISSTKTTPSFITKQAYTFNEPTIVAFDYYMSGNTNNKWWTFAWTASNTAADIYAGVSPSHTTATNDAYELPANVQNTWQQAVITVPAGTWYFYFAGAVNEWSGGYVIIDNFTIESQGIKETFNEGLGIFLDNRESRYPEAITVVVGKEDFVPGEYSARLDFSNNFNHVAQSFYTDGAYASGGSVVSFRYLIPEETTVGDWWAVCWTTSFEGDKFWAVGNGAVSGNGGVNPNPNKTKGAWTEYSITLPDDANMYYIYIVGYQNWSGYVYIDDFKIVSKTGTYTENFNNGLEGSLFSVATADVSLGEGCLLGDVEETPEVPETPVVEDEWAFENILANGEILDVLESGSYASISPKDALTVNADGLPTSMIFLEGVIKYAISGGREFAIYFANGAYIHVGATEVALYDGETKLGTMAGAESGAIRIAVTAGGKVLAQINANAYVGLGTIKAPEGLTLVAFGSEGQIDFDSVAFETYYCIAQDIPTYFSAEQIDFTAYAFDSESMITEEGFQLLADAGFTKTLGLLQGRLPSGDLHEQDIPNREHVENLMKEVNADAMAAIELAEKFGMKHYVLNSNIYNIERNKKNYQWLDDFAELATYKMSQAFAGHFLADEPKHIAASLSQTELEELVNAYKAYKAAFPEGEAFINLLPSTSTEFVLESTYKSYVQYYIDNIALDKNGVKGTGYVSFDHYPLQEEGITEAHLRNLELVAELCRENNLELRTYIKASESGDTERGIRATESVNDLYMQIYSALAYGSKEIIYYQFTDHTVADGSAGDAVISGASLMKNDVYKWAAQANNEVAAFSAAYMNFKWKSASVFGKTSIKQFSNLKSKAGAYGSLTSVSSSASVLVGNFDDADGTYSYGAQNAYMVVNYGDPQDGTAAQSIALTFSGKTRALVYENGQARVVTLTSNVLNLNLEVGEGAFVIPLS